MPDNKFHKFELVEQGTYYLVPKAELEALMGPASKSIKIHIAHADTPTFGQLLCAFRKSRGLTYEKLAQEAQVSARTLKDQETKGTKPQKINLDRLCSYFGIEFENQLPEDLKNLRAKVA